MRRAPIALAAIFAATSGCSHERMREVTSASAAALLGGPDLNGYVAQYECRKGNPHCDVDVEGLVSRPCEQTITASTAPTQDWSAIDWSKDVICIEAGNHRARGRLTLTASGTSTNRKVLRYNRSGDNDDEPWNQSTDSQATLAGLTVDAEYWLVHRLRFVGGVYVQTGRSDDVFNRILVEGFADGLADTGYANHGTVFQNSVLRNGPSVDDSPCFALGPSGHTIVNNEIYDCPSDGILVYESGVDTKNSVIENNDIYITSIKYTNGKGEHDAHGKYACTENGIDLKQGGGAGTPVIVTHNRLWGFRATDPAGPYCSGYVGGVGSAGETIAFHEPEDISGGDPNAYGVLHNNIFLDGVMAITSPNGAPSQWSIVGNIIYDFSGLPTVQTRAYDEKNSHGVEVYLNTFVDLEKGNSVGWMNFGTDSNNDVRCNAVIAGGSAQGWGSAGSTQVDFNAFYGSPEATTESPGKNLSVSIKDRADSATYAVGDVLRVTKGAMCAQETDAGCFLYRVTVAGQSAGSAPAYCTSLGCTIMDGGVTVKAVRGPHCFYRRLRTAPEQVCIPHAAVDLGASDYGFCKTSALGSRAGIGVDDETPKFDGTGKGLFVADLDGTPRLGTPGALEFTPARPKSDAGADGGHLGNDPDGGLDGDAAARNGGTDGDNRLPSSPSADAAAGCSCRLAQSSRGSWPAVLAGIVFASVAARRWRRVRAEERKEGGRMNAVRTGATLSAAATFIRRDPITDRRRACTRTGMSPS